ncbi:hypothetical protein BKH46_07005 [Helicobacter sp. 12S02634-8]|uniref:hypothetical protein n=1 Tax=Helicobacter sp. 12S02634-8 TaxID=1476199 RepID=UPI000BA7DC58|nr:hypothetical protein [Helicobacter sp. 12S02634-8]PAF46492.1 hypothetical protein BKH46_07005 [Helicobacter sp. 12S02634-8]
MKFKYYIAFAILFIIGTALYIYSLDSSTYTLSTPHQAQSFNLPVAIWVAIVILIFFILSLVFFLGEWIRGLVAKYNNNRDFDKITQQIIDQSMQQSFTKQNYKNYHFDLIAKILARFRLTPDLNTPLSSAYKIDKLFDICTQIEGGNEQDLKKYNPSEDNEFFIKNIHNKIQKDPKSALEILKSTHNIPLKKYAFIHIAQKGKDKDIQKALELSKDFLDKEMLKEVFIAYSQNRTTLQYQDIATLCQNACYDPKNYLKLAQASKPFLSPDEWLKLFEYLADKDENAEKSYLYTLLDLEMISEVNERLHIRSQSEFIVIKAYLDLKKIGKNYPLEVFFALDT